MMRGAGLAWAEPGRFFGLAIGPWQQMSPAAREIVAIGAAVVLVTSLSMAWAALLRKRARLRGKILSQHSSTRSAAGSSARRGSEANPEGHRRRRRRRRRDHRPRNPTLSETGGLPPTRSEPPPGL